MHMTRAERYANMAGVIVPFLGLIAAIVFLWNELGRLDRPRHPRRAVRPLRAGHHGRLPPAAHPSRLQDAQADRSTASPSSARWRCRAACSTGSPTTASTTPTPTRRATRTPRTSATARASRASGTPTRAGCSRRTARRTGRSTPRELYEDPVMKKINRLFPLWAFLSLAIPTAARLGAARLHRRGRAARPHLGRPRPRVLPAPHHVVDQLRSATTSAAAASTSRTTRPTSPGSRSRRSARRGTTTTTRSRARPRTA